MLLNAAGRGVLQSHPWHIPFESSWAVFHKVALYNQMSLYGLGRRVARGLRERNGGRAAKANRIRLDDWLAQTDAYDDLAVLLCYVPAASLRQSFLGGAFPQQDVTSWTARNELRICPDCISHGYHSIFHQVLCIDRCPIHETPLLDTCPECRKVIPVATEQGEPFECPTCQHRLWLPYPLGIQRRLNILTLEPQQKGRLQELHRALSNFFRCDRSVLPSCIAALGDFGRDPQWLPAKTWAALEAGQQAKWIHPDKRSSTQISVSKFAGEVPRLRCQFKQGEAKRVACLHIYKAVKRYLKRTVLRSHHRRCVASIERVVWWDTGKEDRWPMCPYGMAYFLWRRRWELFGRRSGMQVTPFSTSLANLSQRDQWAWASVVARAYYWTFWEALGIVKVMAATQTFSWDQLRIRGIYIPAWSIVSDHQGAEITWVHDWPGEVASAYEPISGSSRGHRREVASQLAVIRR